MKLPLQLLSVAAVVACVWAAPKPVNNLKVSFIGKNYDVDGATIAEDVSKDVQKQSGGPVADEAAKLPQVMWGGKKLAPTAFLRDEGVTDGCTIDCMPGEGTNMQDMLKQAGLDTSKLDELMGSMGMGGMGGGDGQMPSMEDSAKMMQDMMNSPMIKDMMSDPERLEQSRLMILNNPMLKSMMAGMPGMDQLLNDPVAWREAMTAAAQMFGSMDPSEMMNAMMGQNNGMGGGLPGAGELGGLFDALDNNAAAAATLDELSEGDD